MLPTTIKKKLYVYRVPILKFRDDTFNGQQESNVHIIGEKIEGVLRSNNEINGIDEYKCQLQKIRISSLLCRQRFMYVRVL